MFVPPYDRVAFLRKAQYFKVNRCQPVSDAITASAQRMPSAASRVQPPA